MRPNRVECGRFGPAVFCLAAVLSLANSQSAQKPENMSMQVTSAAFAEGNAIPIKYTCDEKNVSPPLKWSGTPAGAKSLVLIADDPDAPAHTWVHWVVYNLAAAASELPEDCPK